MDIWTTNVHHATPVEPRAHETDALDELKGIEAKLCHDLDDILGGIRDQVDRNISHIDEGIRPAAGGSRDLNVTLRKTPLNPDGTGSSNEELNQVGILNTIMSMFATIKEDSASLQAQLESNTAKLEKVESNTASIRHNWKATRLPFERIPHPCKRRLPNPWQS